MRWLIVILLIGGGLFYLGKRLMPNPTLINVEWMAPQIRRGMTQDQVRATIGGEPTTVMKGGIGHDETWYYSDMYNADTQLVIQFIDGQAYQITKTGK